MTSVRNTVTNYTFNGRNQLVKSETAGGIAAEYKYYFNSLRSEKGNTKYIYDGKNVLAEVTFEEVELVPPTGGTVGESTQGGETSRQETGLTLNVYGNSLLFTVTESGNLIYTFNAHGDVTRVSDENGAHAEQL